MNAKQIADNRCADVVFIDSSKYIKMFEKNNSIISNQEDAKLSYKNNVKKAQTEYTNNQIFYTADNIATMLGVSRAQAYKLIHTLNDELKKDGYITIAGKVSKAYFNKKYYGLGEQQ